MADDRADTDLLVRSLEMAIATAEKQMDREQKRAKIQQEAEVKGAARTAAALVEAAPTHQVDEAGEQADAAEVEADKAWAKFASIQAEAEGVLKALQEEERNGQP